MSMASHMPITQQLLKSLENLHKGSIMHHSGRAMPPTFLPIGPYSRGYLIGLNEKNCMCGMIPLHNHDRSAKYKTLG